MLLIFEDRISMLIRFFKPTEIDLKNEAMGDACIHGLLMNAAHQMMSFRGQYTHFDRLQHFIKTGKI